MAMTAAGKPTWMGNAMLIIVVGRVGLFSH